MDTVDEDRATPLVDASPVEITPANGGRLVPFVKGSDRASEAGRRSGEVRRAKRALAVEGTSALRLELDRVVDSFERGALGQQAAAVAGLLLARIATGAVKVPGGDYAALLRVLVDIARIEAGEPTSAALVAHVSSGDARARLAALQQQARATIEATAVEQASAAALAAADEDDSPSSTAGPGSDGGRYPPS